MNGFWTKEKEVTKQRTISNRDVSEGKMVVYIMNCDVEEVQPASLWFI